MKLYTKTGDKGITSLYDGTRLPKDDPVFESLGNLDEINAQLGMIKAFWKEEAIRLPIQVYSALFYRDKPSIVPHDYTGPPLYFEWFNMSNKLTCIQRNIMNICSVIATNGTLNELLIDEIEKDIDRLDSLVPELKNFIIPSGNKLCSSIHVCRAITRRAERSCLDECKNVCVYMNRLSDYLFVLSRFVAMTLAISEELN